MISIKLEPFNLKNIEQMFYLKHEFNHYLATKKKQDVLGAFGKTESHIVSLAR